MLLTSTPRRDHMPIDFNYVVSMQPRPSSEGIMVRLIKLIFI